MFAIFAVDNAVAYPLPGYRFSPFMKVLDIPCSEAGADTRIGRKFEAFMRFTVPMKKPIFYLLLLLAGGLLFKACQPSSGREYDNEGYRKAKAYHDSVELHKAAVLSAPETKQMIAGLEDYFDHRLGRHFNGAMLVARQGVVIFEKYQGMANFSDKEPIDSRTTFQLASTSKPFTAMAVLYLQQEGKLDIHDEVSQYFPDFPYEGVTIQSLLNHRSGLPNYLYFCDMYWKDRKKIMSNADVMDILARYKPPRAYAPNTRYNYCNTNYVVLGALIEKITGEPLSAYLKEVFFGPLKMNDTYVYDAGMGLQPHQSLTYDYRTRPIADECFDGVVGDKNVYSTVNDLLKWDQALYAGKLFTPATLEMAYTPYSNEHPGIKNYGLGWHLLVYPDSSKVVYHNGWWHGNNSVFYRFIEDSTTLIILSNRYNKMVYQVQPLWKILHEAAFAADDSGD